nr:hypothetical protein GCM10020092_014690 [Actinoplanes digitatis]
MTHVLLGHASGAVSTLTLSVDAPAALEREDAAFFGESGVADVPPVPWLPVEAFTRAVDALIVAAGGGPASPLDLAFGTEVVKILARRGGVDQDRPDGQARLIVRGRPSRAKCGSCSHSGVFRG